MHATDLGTRSGSLAYARHFLFKPHAILQRHISSDLRRTLTPTLQHFYNHCNAFIIIPTSSDHSSNSPTCTIDATITTMTAIITNSPLYNHYATPMTTISLWTGRRQRSGPYPYRYLGLEDLVSSSRHERALGAVQHREDCPSVPLNCGTHLVSSACSWPESAVRCDHCMLF